MRWTSVIRLLGIVICAMNLALAQTTNGTISGMVFDPTGRAIPNAEVLIINDATGISYPGATNSEGIYAIPNLPPGPYRIQVSKSGFKALIKPDIVLHVEDALAINFTLPIGAASEIVTVEGGAPIINTTDASVSTVIDRNFVQNIALNGQSFNTLLQLTPGVVIAPSSSASPGQFSINGQRTDANYFQVDGVSANFGMSGVRTFGEAGSGGMQGFNALGGTASLASVDGMQEFRVETSSFAPEYGRTPGGHISITTRAGTNRFHGDVFDYFRNTVLDANDWFADAAGLPRAREQQNDFGGVAGGPILKNKAFFFFSYEGLRLRQPQSAVIEVPSPALRNAPTTTPSAKAVLDAYPLPNGPVSADGDAAQFTGSYSTQLTMDAVSMRIDDVINKKESIFGRFSYSPSKVAAPAYSLSTVQDNSIDTTTVTLGIISELTGNSNNAARFNYSRQPVAQSWALDSFGGATALSGNGLFPDSTSPSQGYAHFSPIFDGIAPIYLGTNANNRETQWNVVESYSYLKGAHQLKFGLDYERLLLVQSGLGFSPGYYAISAAQFADSGTVAFLQTQLNNPATVVLNALSAYAQDAWKITPHLTLTYGLRWELVPPPSGQNTRLAAWENVDDLPNLALAPQGTPPWKTRYGNFAPRVGIAYLLIPKRKLVLRAGGGLFYDIGTGIAPALANSFPNGASFLGFPGPFSVPLSSTASVTPSLSTEPPFPNEPILGISPDLELPLSAQWNVAVEKAVRDKQSFSATYVGQLGRRLLRTENEPNPNSNFSGGFTLMKNGDTSNYNALQLQYKMMLHRMQALANYTWSHSIDTNSSDASETVSSVFFPIAGERGSSDFDVRNDFTGAVVYSIPGFHKSAVLGNLSEGWSLSGFVLARSGFPVNIFTYNVPVAAGASTATRPDLVPGVPIWFYGTQCLEAEPLGIGKPCPGGKGLNPNAFVLPSTARQGDLPRNNLYGFGAAQVDVSLQRDIRFSDRVHLEFRVDTFNILNHANFSSNYPFGYVGSPQFGVASQMLNRGLSSQGAGLNALYNIGGPRSLQLSLKLFF